VGGFVLIISWKLDGPKAFKQTIEDYSAVIDQEATLRMFGRSGRGNRRTRPEALILHNAGSAKMSTRVLT
jgi:hypothetical protein